MAQRKDRFLVVAAIDFGTTYSGYAFSTKDDYRREPTNIYTNVVWKDERAECPPSFKCPTSILFDVDGKFDSFGYSAESSYMEKLEEETHKGWRYFNKFKMSLYREIKSLDENQDDLRFQRSILRRNVRLSRQLQLKDDQGNKMSAMTVFAEAIRYLKDHFLRRLKDAVTNTGNDDVHWVLTVPAIWSDAAKQFMRESAAKAGITDDQLTIALEPEAAAIYSRQIAIQRKKEGSDPSLQTFSPGEQFMLIDMGGGTVDITCHEAMHDGTLKEIYQPSGGPWGGTMVDEAYITFLKEVFGQDVWNSFIAQNQGERLDIERKFEIKKKADMSSEFIHIVIGCSIMNYLEEKKGSKLATVLEQSRFRDTVKHVKEKLKIQTSIIENMFRDPLDALIELVQRLLVQRELKDIQTILLVGGFSESHIVNRKMKEAFPRVKVVNPFEAGLAVLKGAVLFGHSPHAISQRSCPRTYGICTSIPWSPGQHPAKSFYKSDGQEKCTDVFKALIRRGEPLIIGKTIGKHTCRPANADDTVATVEIFESSSANPTYTHDESCSHMGNLEIEIPNTKKGKGRLINIQMHFGFTELFVTAMEEGTNHKASIKFDCLS